MSKRNRDTELRRGEQRLQEWGVSGDAAAPGVAALQALLGRDPAADLAIAARLGAIAAPASAEALLALEGRSSDKLVRKEVRRSLYRLEQRGVPVPHAPQPQVAIPAATAGLEGYLSPVDGHGDQLVWLIKPRPGELLHLFVVINDPGGMREAELTQTTRKALRAARQELQSRHALRLVAADWRYCDFIADRAFRWATEAGRTVTGDYRGLRTQLVQNPPTEMAPLVFARIPADTVRHDTQLIGESGTLLEEPEFRTWFFEPARLAPYLDEMRQIRDSPLVLSPPQQQERFRAQAERAVEELFGGTERQSWVRRLEEMAYFLSATDRVDQAKRALAAALALEDSRRGGREIALCEDLVRASLSAYWQAEEQRQQEEARSSLVVTPQQAARELERRRS